VFCTGLCSILGYRYPALHHDHPCREYGGLCAVENQLTGKAMKMFGIAAWRVKKWQPCKLGSIVLYWVFWWAGGLYVVSIATVILQYCTVARPVTPSSGSTRSFWYKAGNSYQRYQFGHSSVAKLSRFFASINSEDFGKYKVFLYLCARELANVTFRLSKDMLYQRFCFLLDEPCG